ncbi:MAG: phosphatase PAP2 family protein, partial [Bacteroidaceae bacterium]|nr:phosphatase PAP2 family protein [Bacteroidaceae bacterium]
MNFPSFDKELLLYINGCNNVLLDGVMQRFSDTWTWALLAVVAIFVILKDRPFKEAVLILFGVALCIVLADQISSSLIKPWVARFRPTHDPEIMYRVRCIAGRAGMYGFVSSHAANTFAVATFLSLVFRHGITSLCLILWATAVSISRVYLAMHFPLDITAGAILGALIGAVVYCL